MPLAMAETITHPNQTHFLEVPLHTYHFPCTSSFLSRKAGLGSRFGGLDAVVAGQVAHEDLSTAKEKAPSSKQE
jgi:hypothetical protein